jgi:hypothetical protein
MARPDFDGEMAVAVVRRWCDDGRLNQERMYSALAVIATHPTVRDYREAALCIALQESAAMAGGAEGLGEAMASVERHRGVLAFCMTRYGVALECFTRALERERTAENLANVLASLVRLGDIDSAMTLLAQARLHLDSERVVLLDQQVALDDDLAELRG